MYPRRNARRLARLLPAAGFLLALLLAGRTAIPAAHAQPPAVDLAAARAALAARPVAVLPSARTLTIADVPPSDLVSGRATVTFAPDVSAEQARGAIDAIGGSVLLAIPRLNVYEVALPDGQAVADGIASLSALPGALTAEPEERLESAFHPNDPLYGPYQSYLPLLHAEQAWDIQQGDPRITVAVLDSGVDISHPDLAGQIWQNPNPGAWGCGDDEHGCNFVDPRDVDPSCPNQDPDAVPNPDIRPYYYHGTFVSGIIGAATNNGIGVAGVSPHVTLMPVRVGDCIRPNDPALAAGLIYAADNGAWIANISIGGSCLRPPSYLANAIAYAQQRNVVIVAAAGNSGSPCVETPANIDGVIAVGALAPGGQTRATFSSYGPQISVVAPGQRIISTVPQTDRPAPRDFYDQQDGTSFSAPMVAGLAHLLLSQDSVMTPDVVRGLIERGAVPLADGRTPGWAGAGRIDLAASLRLVPAGFFGNVSFDGAPVVDGTPVAAFINGRPCGQTTTYSTDAGSSFVIYVAAAADVPGCGAPGSTVTFTVAGQVAGSAAWRPAAVAQDLALGGAAPSGRAMEAAGALVRPLSAAVFGAAPVADIPPGPLETSRRGRRGGVASASAVKA
ncbi:MAG TPA: S8 family serine peptidase [Dehalococcoidia bacterium]|nr:S8 family serine peptidase [Dehalococcoidia bacterium]